jgi:hypothetical protein
LPRCSRATACVSTAQSVSCKRRVPLSGGSRLGKDLAWQRAFWATDHGYRVRDCSYTKYFLTSTTRLSRICAEEKSFIDYSFIPSFAAQQTAPRESAGKIKLHILTPYPLPLSSLRSSTTGSLRIYRDNSSCVHYPYIPSLCPPSAPQQPARYGYTDTKQLHLETIHPNPLSSNQSARYGSGGKKKDVLFILTT